MKSYSVQCEQQRNRTVTSYTRTSRSHTSNIVPERLAVRVKCTNSQSSLRNIQFHFCGFQTLLQLFTSAKVRSVPTKTKCATEPIRSVTLHFRGRRGAASLRQLAQQAFPVEIQHEIWSGSKKKNGRGRGKEGPSLPSPLLPFFALVPVFSTNSRGTACYAGYPSVTEIAPKITVLLCEQTPYPVWFSFKHKSYPVRRMRKHNLSLITKSKATGLDKISARPLRECADLIASSVCCIFNRSITTDIFPEEWKCSKVIPLLKARRTLRL